MNLIPCRWTSAAAAIVVMLLATGCTAGGGATEGANIGRCGENEILTGSICKRRDVGPGGISR